MSKEKDELHQKFDRFNKQMFKELRNKMDYFQKLLEKKKNGSLNTLDEEEKLYQSKNIHDLQELIYWFFGYVDSIPCTRFNYYSILAWHAGINHDRIKEINDIIYRIMSLSDEDQLFFAKLINLSEEWNTIKERYLYLIYNRSNEYRSDPRLKVVIDANEGKKKR